MLRFIRRTCVLLLLLTTVAGCVSTKDRYEKAALLESQGRYAEAAGAYLKVLQREPSYRDARARLETVGRKAVDVYLDQAVAAEQAGRFEEAAEALAALDALRLDALRVGVDLPVPADYDAFRDEVTQEALEVLIQRGEAAEQRGAWGQALDAYGRAQARYPLTAEQHQALDETRARVYLRWAEDEARLNRYQAAYNRAAQALDLLGPRHPLAQEAQLLQEDVLEEGMRRVAFLPFGQLEGIDQRDLVRDLNDVLLYDYWSDLPLFLALADPVETRRFLRRRYEEGRPFDRREAAAVGRALGTAYVVVGELTDYREEEQDVREETKRASLRLRGRTGTALHDTSYVMQRYALVLSAVAVYRIVDTVTRRVVDQGSASAEVSEAMRRARYAGDYRTLRLSSSEQALFDEEAVRAAERRLEEELVGELADRLAAAVRQDLLRLVP